MKIYFTVNSPYARIARIAAHTCAVDFDGIQLTASDLRNNANPVLAHNATGRIPTLLDGDTVVTESRAVCRYLESVGDGTKIFAYSGDWPAEQMENTAMSHLDGCALWTREYRRPEYKQFDGLCNIERERAINCLDWFNAHPDIQSSNSPWDFAHIVLAVAIEYMDFRDLITDWRDGRDQLAAWQSAQMQRPSMQANPMVPGA
jgi:glutathione S-transferase